MTDTVRQATTVLQDGLAAFLTQHQHEDVQRVLRQFATKHHLPHSPKSWSLQHLLEFYAHVGPKYCPELSNGYIRTLAHELLYTTKQTLSALPPEDLYRFLDSAERLLASLRMPQARTIRTHKYQLATRSPLPGPKPEIVVIAPEEAVKRLQQPADTPPPAKVGMFKLTDLCYTILSTANTFMSAKELHQRLTQAGFHYNQRSISLTLKHDPRFVYKTHGRTYYWGLASWDRNTITTQQEEKIKQMLSP